MLASPVFPDQILSVTVEGGTKGSSTTRVLALIPVINGVRGTAINLDPPSVNTFTTQTLDLSGLGATKFYIETPFGSGNWAVRTITVVYGEEDPVIPEVKDVGSVNVSGTDADAFRLSWDAVDGAEGYVVSVWSNGVVGASDGVEVLYEGFSSVTNRAVTSTWSIDEINQLGDYHGWSGDVIRGYPSKEERDEEHAVLLGATKSAGWLMSGPLEVSGEATLRFRLTRNTSDDTKPLSVAFVKDGVTNFAGSVSFGTAIHAFADYSIVASNLTEGCQLLISSQAKGSGAEFGRVAISEISVVCGSSLGTTVPIPVVSDELVEDDSYLFAEASPVPYGYSVAAQFMKDGEHVESEPVAGMVDMSAPPWLRCWRAADFLPKPGSRILDLAGLGTAGSARDWLNGQECEYIYAFADTGENVKIRSYSDSPLYYSIYRLNEGVVENPDNAIGMLGTGTSGVRLVLPIRLDTELPLERITVSYALSRLTWKEDVMKETKATFAWMTHDDFGAMQDKDVIWHNEESGGFAATSNGETRVERSVEITDRSLRKAKYLFLKWEVPKQQKSAMIGLTDLTVAGSLRKAGFFLSIK